MPQWFHFDCVGLRSTPEGTWLCPMCVVLRKSNLRLAGGVKLPSVRVIMSDEVEEDDDNGHSANLL